VGSPLLSGMTNSSSSRTDLILYDNHQTSLVLSRCSPCSVS
jgi:hypothetical protein